METIIYQGQPVEAKLVNYLSGNLPTSTVDHDGDEALLRDEAGHYYLRRKLDRLDSQGEGPREASGRTHVHRLSVNAAILWATTRLNSETLDLRIDAAALLTKHKVQPGNVHLDAAVPAGFEAEANRLGFSARQYLWYLAEDAVARPRREVKIVQVEPPVPAVLEVPTPAQVVEGVHRFTFEYAATERFCGMRRTVELSDEQMERAHALAAVFGLDLPAFLRGLANRNDLPGQPRRSELKLADLLQAEHLGFVCTDAALARRIERAAQACSQSVDEFVAHALGGHVDMWEECMLLDPTTGDLLDTDYEDLYGTVEEKMVVPPTGREDEARFRNSLGKERVNFGVSLRPDQLERLEYPHFVTDCATGAELAFALIPLDAEGSPSLSVGRRELQPGEPLPQSNLLLGPQPRGERKGVA